MLVFKKAKIEDAAILAEVQRQAFAEDVAQYGDGPPGFDSTDWQVTKLETSIYYKILYSKHIIGGIVVESKGNGHYVLNRLFVDPNFQSKGIGASAVGFIEKTISDARKWTLQTLDRSYRNHYFYEKMGYTKAGETIYPGDGIAFDYEKIVKTT